MKLFMATKQCTRCKIIKKLSEFNKRNSSKDGLHTQCRLCTREVATEYKERNKQVITQKKAIYDKKRYQENRELIIKRARQYGLRNKDKKVEYDKKYYKENKNRITKKKSSYYLKNKQKVKEYYDNWYKQNQCKVYANNKKYENAKRMAAPKWLTQEQIKQIELLYKDRQLIESLTGVGYDIDHVVPLRGNTVCGLHVPWNLQILTRAENSAKRNKLII